METNQYVEKMKDYYELKIETLKLEHKIEILELKNEIQTLRKRESESEKKLLTTEKRILEIEKENLEKENMWKMKIVELEKQYDALRHKLEVAELESAKHDDAHTLKDSVREIQNKEKMLTLEKENLCLKHQIKMKELKKKLEGVKDENDPVVKYPRFIPLLERLMWGAQTFFEGVKPDLNLYKSYEKWYTDIFKRMDSRRVYYAKEKYFFFRITITSTK